MTTPATVFGHPYDRRRGELLRCASCATLVGLWYFRTPRRMVVAATPSSTSDNSGSVTYAPQFENTAFYFDDADAGRRYAADVIALLAKLTSAPLVKVLELDDLPPGGDAFDFIESYRSAGALTDEQIRSHLESCADRIAPVETNGPASVGEKFQPFPVGVLPEPIRSFVATSAQAIGCDPSYIALPLLAALAAAIGNTRRIQLKRGWSEPPIIWAVIRPTPKVGA